MTQPSVRFSSPAEVARALPLLLGYYPSESLVVSYLTANGNTVGLTLRFDLETLIPVSDVVADLVARGELAHAIGAFIVVYTERAFHGDDLPHGELIEALFDQPDLVVQEALVVSRGRWWSYFCAGYGCCPADGTPFEEDSEALTTLEASMVMAGSAVLADRAELVAAVAAEESAETPAQRRRMTIARKRVEAMPPEQRRGELADLIEMLTVWLADPRGIMTDAEVARLAALCADIGARDDLLVQAVSPQRRTEILGLLRAAVRRVPAPHDAAICAVLAWFAYAAGDGTLVNIALDRVFRTNPIYSLALLLESSLERQLPPSMIVEVISGAARDIAARDAAG